MEEQQEERLSQETTVRVVGSPPRREPDGLIFNWELPDLAAPTVITFLVEVRSQSNRSRVQFELHLTKLQTPDLERLHEILALRHAGVDDRGSLMRSIAWMLTVSISQTAPHLTQNERKVKAHRLLLLPPPSEMI